MIANILSCLILLIRPFLGPATCRYEVGCTAYALEQLKTKSLFSALRAIVKRIFSCW